MGFLTPADEEIVTLAKAYAEGSMTWADVMAKTGSSAKTFITNVNRVLNNPATRNAISSSTRALLRTAVSQATVEAGGTAGGAGILSRAASALGLTPPGMILLTVGVTTLMVGGYIYSKGDPPVQYGAAASAPRGTMPATPSISGADSYAIFLLTNVSGGTIMIGNEEQLKTSKACGFAGGGNCNFDETDPLVTYEKKSEDFAQLSQAEAYFCENLTNIHYSQIASSYVAEGFGGEYWLLEAPICAED